MKGTLEMKRKMKRENFVDRLLRIFIKAGYAPACLLTISPRELAEIPGITVPGIRLVLRLQYEIMENANGMSDAIQLVDRYIREVLENG